jgi:hypothetical protein
MPYLMSKSVILDLLFLSCVEHGYGFFHFIYLFKETNVCFIALVFITSFQLLPFGFGLFLFSKDLRGIIGLLLDISLII